MKTAIITGASSGLGKVFAETINTYDTFDEVWVIARRLDRLESLQEMVGSDGTLGYTEKRQYLGISQATDIAEAICFLLGEESKMITGTNMDISGGFLTS